MMGAYTKRVRRRIVVGAVFCFAAGLMSASTARAALEVAALANADLLSRPGVQDDDPAGPLFTVTVDDVATGGAAHATVTMDGVSTTSAGVAISAGVGEFEFIAPSAVAAFTEGFTFAQTGQVSFTFDVEGTVTGTHPELVSLSLAASQDIGSITDLAVLPIFIDSQTITGSTTSLTVGPFDVVGGVLTEISFFLIASGLAIGPADFDADFLSTVTLTGATDDRFTSESGNPYNSSLVVNIPSPATALTLFIAGLLGLVPVRQKAPPRRR